MKRNQVHDLSGQQLAKAGFRLASLLNQLWPPIALDSVGWLVSQPLGRGTDVICC
jgi:hypothetical protein